MIASLESEQAQLRAESDQAERDASAIELGAPELAEAEGSLAEERQRFEADWGEGVPALTGEAAGLRGELAALRSAIERTHNDRSRLESRRASLAERVERLGAEVVADRPGADPGGSCVAGAGRRGGRGRVRAGRRRGRAGRRRAALHRGRGGALRLVRPGRGVDPGAGRGPPTRRCRAPRRARRRARHAPGPGRGRPGVGGVLRGRGRRGTRRGRRGGRRRRTPLARVVAPGRPPRRGPRARRGRRHVRGAAAGRRAGATTRAGGRARRCRCGHRAGARRAAVLRGGHRRRLGGRGADRGAAPLRGGRHPRWRPLRHLGLAHRRGAFGRDRRCARGGQGPHGVLAGRPRPGARAGREHPWHGGREPSRRTGGDPCPGRQRVTSPLARGCRTTPGRRRGRGHRGARGARCPPG